MEEERLSLLRAVVNNQKEEIESIFIKVEQRRDGKGAVNLESLAYQLHNLYCAFEDLFKIVANFFENHIEDKSKYHRELLLRMKISIEGIRPALLRAFRHVFRHAYSYELDQQKVDIIVEDVLKLKDLYEREIDYFLEQF